jgi:2-phosphosulfolactate phosphatase
MKSVIPVASVEEAQKYAGKGYIVAAERGGEVVEGFSYGNSPLSYRNNPDIIGKKLVLTTTNGTQAIAVARDAAKLCVGAFSNITTLSSWLVSQQNDVMILCSGWKNRLNLEDTIFAGALTRLLLNQGFQLDIDSDAALTALTLYEQSKADIYRFLEPSSHRQRLSKLNLHKDIEYCLQWDTTSAIPVLINGELINLQP